MANIKRVHCLFEQSGTFKRAFNNLGIEAFDYDIANDFGETDYTIDLFKEIRGGYEGEQSIFDSFEEQDIIFAFFPCIRFENQIMLHLRGQANHVKDWCLLDKLEYCMKLQSEITEMYDLVNMLFVLCIKKHLRLIMENPYSEEHYLRRYWCIPASIIDKDRRVRGDYFKKPTQYWFLNFKPKNNFIFEPLNDNSIDCKDAIRNMNKEKMNKAGLDCSKKVARSMIHPDYADRFIREFII